LIGAHRAALDYDPSRGEFPKYAKWFIHCAIKTAIADGSLIRMGLKLRKTLGDDAPKREPVDVPEGVEPAEDPLELDEIEHLRAAVDRLPRGEREVIQLRFGLADGRGRSLKETGAALGFSDNTALKYERRALMNLRGMTEI
jgi:RNA polymerase sigma factor (sigma-70 family)